MEAAASITLELDFLSLFMHINEFSPRRASMIWWLDNKRQLLLKKHDVSKRLVCGRECEALVDLNEIFIEDNLRFLSPLALNNFSIKSFNPRHVVCWEFFCQLLLFDFERFMYTDVPYRLSACHIKVNSDLSNFAEHKRIDFTLQ